MVEYFVTKAKLVVRNSEPLVMVGEEAKALSKLSQIISQSIHCTIS